MFSKYIISVCLLTLLVNKNGFRNLIKHLTNDMYQDSYLFYLKCKTYNILKLSFRLRRLLQKL